MRSIWFVFFLSLLVLSGCSSVNGPGNSSTATSTAGTSPAVQPRYLLGGGYPFPYDYSTFVPDTSAALVADTAQVAFVQLNWQESANPGSLGIVDALAAPVASARRQGLKVYVAFENLSPDRSQVVLPAGLTGDFTSSTVQQAYLDTVTAIATRYQPDYFILSVEVNLNRSDAANYSAYQQVYALAHDAVKRVSPNTRVGVSLFYAGANSQNCYDSTDKAQLAGDAADFPKQDIFAVSVYPICYADPKNIPDSFLFDLSKLSSQPLFVSETGWPSQANGWATNETLQAAYFPNLQRAADYAKNQGQQIEVINYIGIIDAPVQACNMIEQILPQDAWWCSLGIRNRDGSPKLAHAAMKTWSQSLESGQ